jgi:hypothetical protein
MPDRIEHLFENLQKEIKSCQEKSDAQAKQISQLESSLAALQAQVNKRPKHQVT